MRGLSLKKSCVILHVFGCKHGEMDQKITPIYLTHGLYGQTSKLGRFCFMMSFYFCVKYWNMEYKDDILKTYT